MAVPKRKTSKMKIRTRQAANRWRAPKLSRCTQCGAVVRAHTACPACGYYKERQVLSVDSL